jgi:hypothetical protein
MSVPLQPRSATTGDRVLAALVVAGIVAVSAAVAWAIRPQSGQATPADVLPVEGAERWSVTAGGVLPQTFDADANSVAMVADGELLVLEAATGTERWSRDLSDDARHEIGLYGDYVVAVSRTPTETTVAGYRLTSGTRWWHRTRDDIDIELRPTGVVEYLDTRSNIAMRVIDPATGEVIGPASVAADLPAPAGFELGRSANLLVLVDITTGGLNRPAVPDLGLTGVAPVGDDVVGFTDTDDIVLFDRSGGVLDQRPFVSGAPGDFRGRAGLVGGVPGTSIGIVASGSSIGFDVADGRIEVIWELLGRVGPPVDTAVGPVAIARLVDPETGEVDIAIVDVRTGTPIAITDLGLTREGDPVVVHDGYVAAPAAGDPARVISAVGFDGVQRWALPTPPGSWYDVLAGTLYLVDPSSGTLTAYG